ncbi:MAG: serine/threonine-protein kinase [Kofleriaceae bacterium]|nr:serine/threonine-protein kinase [Kofleriaceae bacterium]
MHATITGRYLPPVTVPQPDHLGAYRLLEKLGQGGMAVVYRGERSGDAGFRKRVAIKRILPQYRRDSALLERFAAEARTNARLDHPNLVQVLDFGIDPEPYLVLEYIEGVTLGAIMQRLSERREKLDVAAACFIGAEVANGLDHAHRKKDDDGTPLGIVHRDVSPQNVLISNEGTVKVSDFGLVKAADNVLTTQAGVPIGKLSYMAPEQASGGEVDGRADVFSLGVTLWEMLTIRSLIPPDDPAAASTLMQSGAFLPPSHFNAEVPPLLDDIVMGCLRVDRESRTPSAQQISQELRELLHQRAAGYGRQQLARFVQWLFPERGWDLPEPERPPVQPSADERASMVPVTPAVVAVARAAAADAPVAPAQPAQRGSVPTFAMLGFAAAVLVGAAILAVLLGWAVWREPTVVRAPLPLPMPVPVSSRGEGDGASLMLESGTPGIRLFLGVRELGTTPVRLPSAELTGEPLVALAPGHQPVMIRAERLVELTRSGSRVHRLDLEPSHRPDWMIYVRYEGQGAVYLPSGEDLGPVPGVVRVRTQRDAPPPTSLRLVDEFGAVLEVSLDGCEADKVCVVYPGQHASGQPPSDQQPSDRAPSEQLQAEGSEPVSPGL